MGLHILVSVIHRPNRQAGFILTKPLNGRNKIETLLVRGIVAAAILHSVGSGDYFFTFLNFFFGRCPLLGQMFFFI